MYAGDRKLHIPKNILESLQLFDEGFQSSGLNEEKLHIVDVPYGWDVISAPEHGTIPGLSLKQSLILPFENSRIVGEFITLVREDEKLQIHYQFLDGKKTNWMFEVLPID
jgi:hypothetical protein